MKQRILKIMTGITTAAVLFTAVGCSKSEKTTSENLDYPGAEITLNGADIYPMTCDDTLTWWKSLGDLGTTFENFGDTPVAKKYAEETGVKVEYMHPIAGSAAEQMQLMIASDELPDIVEHGWNSYPGGPEMAITDEYIYELSDLIDKYAPAFKKHLTENASYDKQIKTDNGKYYAFPRFVQEGLNQICYGPYLRQDWLDKLGLEKPETIDEWENVLTAFKDEMGAEAPFVGNTLTLFRTFASAFDIYCDWYQDNGTIKYGYIEPGYKELLAKLNSWYEKGLICPDIASIDGNTINTKILNGKFGATAGWAASQMGVLLDAGKDLEGFKLAGVQFPVNEKGKVSEYNYITAPVHMASGVAISRNCKNPELAVRLIDFAFTEKGHMLANFGIEGESYNMEGDYPKYSDLIHKNPENKTISQAIAAYTLQGHVPMYQEVRYIEQYYEQPELKDAQKEWVKTNMNDHLMPQIYVLGEESEKDADIMAACKTYIDEMSLKFITGAESLDKFDEYLAQLEEFGINDAIKFRQSAYERYQSR